MVENLKKLAAIFLLLLFLYLSFKIIKLFLVSILWALIFSIVFYPLSNYFSKKLKGETKGILLTTLIFILIILVPLTFFITKLSLEIYSFTPELLNQLSKSGSEMEKYYLEAKKVFDNFGISLGDVTNFFAKNISMIIQKLIQNFFKFFFNLFFIIIFFYTFLKYKSFFISILNILLPFSEEKNNIFFTHISNFVQAIFYGIFLTALIQGFFATIGFYIFKIPAPLFFGTLVFVFSFIPIGGSSIVWAPLSLYLILIGNIKSGIILFFWCLILVSTLYNLIRPYLVSKRYNINPLFIFISILGGVSAFGGIGIFYGPLTLFLFYHFINNYKEIK